jgi:putative RNA 2'-phosphotransferase
MNLTQLSKTISHALRHQPWLYELELDNEGWISVDALLTALRQHRADWKNLVADDIARMMAASDKQRFELKAGRIRALYGHSLPNKLLKQLGKPPDLLYHGTSPKAAQSITREGLKPMGRQYVHLSADKMTALQVGRRKAKTPVILKIQAAEAFASGVRFYAGNEKVWLADYIPPQFIFES